MKFRMISSFIIISLFFVTAQFSPGSSAVAARDVMSIASGITSYPSPVELKMLVGSPGFTHDGKEYPAPAPIWLKESLHLPVRAVAEAFGAEISYEPKNGEYQGGVTGSFRDRVFSLEFGREKYMINGAWKSFGGELSLCSVNGITYAPFTALDACIGTTTTYDASQDVVNVKLPDDGSVRDLSETLGEIREIRAGDSYFNWSMDVPAKSMLVHSSFNGDEVGIYSSLHDAYIFVSVKPTEGLSPDEHLEKGYDSVVGVFFDDGEVKGDGRDRYVEFQSGGGVPVVVMRLYTKARYDYRVMVSAGIEDNESATDSSVFAEGGMYKRLLDSFTIGNFNIGANGGALVRDLTKVKDGTLKYTSYLNLPEGDRLLTPWSFFIPPDWSELYQSSENDSIYYGHSGENNYTSQIKSVIGTGADENISVTIREASGFNIPLTSASALKEYYNGRFRDGFCRIVDVRVLNNSTNSEVTSRLFDITYTISHDGGAVKFLDRIIKSGGLIYLIRVRAPQRLFDKRHSLYESIMDSFEVVSTEGNVDVIAEYLKKKSESEKERRLSKTDLAAIINGISNDSWESKLPGNYIEMSQDMYLSNTSSFPFHYKDPLTGAGISVNYMSGIDPDDFDLEEMKESIGNALGSEVSESLEEVTYGNNTYMRLKYSRDVKHTASRHAGDDGSLSAEDINAQHSFPVSPLSSDLPYDPFDYGSGLSAPGTIDYSAEYFGFPVAGEIYLRITDDDIFGVLFEIPGIFYTAENHEGVEMLLDNFRLKEFSSADAKAGSNSVRNDDNVTGGSPGGGTQGKGGMGTGFVPYDPSIEAVG